jgi:hypothetical protein
MWDYPRLLDLKTNAIPESDAFDFKAKGALSRSMSAKEEIEISKDISAFANYPGGTIVFGAAEKRVEKVKTRVIGEFDGYDPGEMSADWIESKITNLVSLPLSRFNVFAVPTGDGKNVFIVEMERSPIAPHQARDLRYYLRKGASSVAANHLETEGIRHAGGPVDLVMEYGIGSRAGDFSFVDLTVVVRNRGGRACRGIYIVVTVMNHSQISWNGQSAYQDQLRTTLDGRPATRFCLPFGGHQASEIVYPGQPTQKLALVQASHKQNQSLRGIEMPVRLHFELQSLDGFRITEEKTLQSIMNEAGH